MRPAVKAGLIGAGVAIVLTLLGLLPLCGCIAEPLIWLAYAGAGALAAHFMLTTGRGPGTEVHPDYSRPVVVESGQPGDEAEARVYYAPRPTGSPAGEGALAGLITGALQGIIRVALAPLTLTMAGGPQTFVNSLPPESLKVLTDAGIDPQTLFGTATFVTASAVCCGIGIVAAAALGALGGLIYGAMRQR